MKDTYKIKDLDQVRLLSDPLKLQLLQAFAESDLDIIREIFAEGIAR